MSVLTRLGIHAVPSGRICHGFGKYENKIGPTTKMQEIDNTEERNQTTDLFIAFILVTSSAVLYKNDRNR